MATMTPTPTFKFMTLPLELREEIYNHVFQISDLKSVHLRQGWGVWHFRFSIFQFPLARTCWEIRNEMLAALERADFPIQIAQCTDWALRRRVRFTSACESTSLQGRGGIDTKLRMNFCIDNKKFLIPSLLELDRELLKTRQLHMTADELEMWTIRIRHGHQYKGGRLSSCISISDAFFSEASVLEASREMPHDCACGCMSPGKT
jgi:hypothetical protein